MIDLLKFLAFATLVVSTVVPLILWVVHISMTKEDVHSKSWGWGSYSLFLREFNKMKDWRSESWGYSLFCGNGYPRDGYLHASVIRFNQTGMVIRDPISYLRVQLFIRRYIGKKPRHNWSKDVDFEDNIRVLPIKKRK